MPQSRDDHAARAAAETRSRPVGCAVLTVSDSRTSETDQGGPLVARLLEEAGHRLVDRDIVRDDPSSIGTRLDSWLSDERVHAILTTGGTGIARRDTTIEIVQRLLTTALPGFGELFRMLSYEQVQSSAMLSRAVGGLVIRDDDQGGETFVFAIPGSLNAVETAMRKLIVPELAHLVWERRR